MLGEKRSRNLFAEETGSKASEDKVPEAKVSEPEVPALEEQVPECSDHSAPQNQEASAMIQLPTRREPSVRHTLFFEKEETRSFSEVLREVQGYLSQKYSSLVTEDGTEESKHQIRRFAAQYIQNQRIAVEGMTTEELIDRIYSEMAEFGFLTKYIYGDGIEEIDINAWDDVEIQCTGGVTKNWRNILRVRSMPSMLCAACCTYPAWC